MKNIVESRAFFFFWKVLRKQNKERKRVCFVNLHISAYKDCSYKAASPSWNFVSHREEKKTSDFARDYCILIDDDK